MSRPWGLGCWKGGCASNLEAGSEEKLIYASRSNGIIARRLPKSAWRGDGAIPGQQVTDMIDPLVEDTGEAMRHDHEKVPLLPFCDKVVGGHGKPSMSAAAADL